MVLKTCQLIVRGRVGVFSSRLSLSRSIAVAFPKASFSTKSADMAQPSLSEANMNQNLRVMQYAVRGPIVVRAGEIEQELKNGAKKPFDKVIRANIGDCHATGQKPLKFLRQVLALCVDSSLFDSDAYPADAKERAQRILDSSYGRSLGSYSDSVGIRVIREDAAKYIEQRDGGIKCNPDNIMLTTGASEGVKIILGFVNHTEDGKPCGAMIPVPQYPLYSATAAEFGMTRVSYYLDEEKNWALDIKELNRAFDEAKETCTPRVLCVINPGNPTGAVLTRENIESVIKFASEKKLVLLADEVYQDNVYGKGCKFYSFKKVMSELPAPYNQVELVSFHSTSKGYMGECGLRGGYMEVVNFDAPVMAQLKKVISARLCSTTIGQATMGVVVNPPKEGEPSYPSFLAEKNQILESLARKAKLVQAKLNDIEGITCNEVQGAMYAFPQLKFPQAVIDAAKKKGQQADYYWAMTLLEECGICLVPGSGFLQRPGTYHFRTTILPPEDQIADMLGKIAKFHKDFLARHE